jgi:ArsR family transcriptional regulator
LNDVDTIYVDSMVVNMKDGPMSSPTTSDLCCQPLLGAPLDEAEAEALATVMKALADPVRLRLISLISAADGGEACACDLPALVDRSQPTVSHHLSQLVAAGILEREQRGKWAWFRVRPERLDALRRLLVT